MTLAKQPRAELSKSPVPPRSSEVGARVYTGRRRHAVVAIVVKLDSSSASKGYNIVVWRPSLSRVHLVSVPEAVNHGPSLNLDYAKVYTNWADRAGQVYSPAELTPSPAALLAKG